MAGLLVAAAASSGLVIRAPLVLGSSSATRKALMRELGHDFEVQKPEIDEKAIGDRLRDDPEQLVLAIGKAKAAKLLAADGLAARGAFLLTGDQVVVCGGKILEKPEDEAEARRFIGSYGTTPPSTVGSTVVTDSISGAQFMCIDRATVHFEPIPAASIDALVAEGEVFYCAGALMVEHELVQPHVVRMEGTIDSVMGLCKASVTRLLGEAVAAREAAAH